MTGSRGVRRTSVLRLATEPTKAAFCITAFFDVNHSSLLAFQGLRLAVGIQNHARTEMRFEGSRTGWIPPSPWYKAICTRAKSIRVDEVS